jgi:hypothetical protein
MGCRAGNCEASGYEQAIIESGAVHSEKNHCRVCGYKSKDARWGEDGQSPLYDFCPCCGVEHGYLSLQRRADGDEIAITVDVWSNADQFNIEADICTGHDGVLIIGPRAAIPVASSESTIDARSGAWLHEMQQFLDKHQQSVLSAASELT